MSKTNCKFMGGPSDGKTIAVDDRASKVSVPGMDYGCLVSHEYVRVGPAKFEFTETKKESFLDERPTNLDYVLGLREQRVALEAENAKLRGALEICLGHLTGGMDGNWADCDPVETARAALHQDDKPSHDEATA